MVVLRHPARLCCAGPDAEARERDDMSMSFDPEVPGGYQDADIEMAEMRERASEMIECTSCQEMVHPDDCESVVVHQHRIEGRVVAQDIEDVCKACVEEAEESQVERMIEQQRLDTDGGGRNARW